MHRSRGFTLIELLVVIAIIGLLSSIVLASLNTARQKGFDAQRVSNMRAIQTALELYYNDHGQYPPGNGSNYGWASQCPAWGGVTASNVIPGLTPSYMASFPTDPQMNTSASTCCYLYIAGNGDQDYKLLLHNCPTSYACYGTGEATSGFYDPVRPTWACQISTPGAQGW
ncbi:MAG: type II secretion system protein [Patescibacteria group bacterium]|nr:type II secretion system GspH family protein [Patescibacteria group bacterium]MDE1944277.1 type II secretion system protein [Patescibacteria group bacterium]MDE1944664.1 type II secretion system protein [Patescibacteria group bacterium]MDE2057350.1 type II secretion system protein [Patescibacteria group bacterium]